MRAERDGKDVDGRWVLHASDRTLLGNKTGATRRGFAILLTMFQANGRFPYRLEEVPVAAVEAIASQIALTVLGSSALWLGIRYPTANFWGGRGFGPNWECEILGKGSAQVCFPDVPRAADQSPNSK